MGKCILLVRVSTEKQSFDEQEKELYELASRDYAPKDITIIAHKESAIKLSEEERQGITEMKACIESGGYDCVYAWEISRIARKKKVLFSILEYLQERKIQLIIKDPEIRLLNDDGSINESAETVFTLFAQLAESEMRNKKARFSRGRKANFEKGKYIGGFIPIGYRVDENGYWQVDPEESILVREIFELYNSGEYSLTTLAVEMQQRGFRRHLSITNMKNTLSKLLRNEIYIGKQTSNNRYPALIDMETWNKTVERRKKNLIISKSPVRSLLSMLIFCKCGSCYSANMLDGTYECRVRHNAVEKGLEHSPGINCNMVESIAWYVAVQELQTDNVNRRADLRMNTEKEIKVLELKIETSEKEVETLRQKQKDLNDRFWTTSQFSEDQYNELVKKQDEKIENESKRIKINREKITRLQKTLEDFESFEEKMRAIVSTDKDVDFETKRQIIHRYIKEIRVYPIEGKPTNYWKKVSIKTVYGNDYSDLTGDFPVIGQTLGTHEFTLDTKTKRFYIGDNLDEPLPVTYYDRVQRRRKEYRTKKNKKDKK